jgi:hypothetical protein
LIERLPDIPYAKKLDFHFDGKGLLELRAEVAARIVIPLVRKIRVRQHFGVGWREKPNFLEHTGEGTSFVSTM